MSETPKEEGTPREAEAGRSPLDHPVAAAVILCVATLAVLLPARGYLGPFTPLGDDASSHIATIATLADALRSGDGWWSPDYNGGFPMVLYYQPLPHLFSAIVTAAIGDPMSANGVYKVLMTLMLALQPWAVFVGLRRAGARSLDAALAGFVAPLVIQGVTFGYHAQASLQVGLYTQAWGNVALPLAFGELAAAARGKPRVGVAIAACAFVASTHMFYAIALVGPALLMALAGGKPLETLRAYAATGAGALLVLAPWLLPLTRNQAFFGGWPFGRPTRVHGYGFSEVISWATTGTILDGDGTPILSAIALLGAIVAVGIAFTGPSRATRVAARSSLVLVLWAFVGAIGRGTEDASGFGGLIDLINPLHRSVQLFRYGALLQFALVALVGVGAAAIARGIERAIPARTFGTSAAIVVLTAGAVLPLRAGVEQLNKGFRTIDETSHFRAEPYQRVATWLGENAPGGRMYITKRSGLRGHYHSGLMTWAAQRPAAQSYGVGLHDSLHFYTLEYLHPGHRGALALADVFDFRIIVHTAGADLAGFGAMTELYRAGRYRVSALRVSGDAVSPMREAAFPDDVPPEGRVGTPRVARRSIRAWMQSNGPATGQTLVLDIDDPRSRERLVGYPSAPERGLRFPDLPPVGETLESEMDGGRFSATVRLDEPGLIVAKVGYHPFWRVTLDGEPAETVFAYPGFVAVRAGAGVHEVQGRFRWPTSSRVLLWFTPSPFLILLAVRRRRAQKNAA